MTASRPEHRAHLSALSVSHWSAKDAGHHGMVASVLDEMAGLGLAERAGSRWVATPAGQRAYRARKAAKR